MTEGLEDSGHAVPRGERVLAATARVVAAVAVCCAAAAGLIDAAGAPCVPLPRRSERVRLASDMSELVSSDGQSWSLGEAEGCALVRRENVGANKQRVLERA